MTTVIIAILPPETIRPMPKSISAKITAHTHEGKTPCSPLYFEVKNPDIAPVKSNTANEKSPELPSGFFIDDKISEARNARIKKIAEVKIIPKIIAFLLVLQNILYKK